MVSRPLWYFEWEAMGLLAVVSFATALTTTFAKLPIAILLAKPMNKSETSSLKGRYAFQVTTSMRSGHQISPSLQLQRSPDNSQIHAIINSLPSSFRKPQSLLSHANPCAPVRVKTAKSLTCQLYGHWGAVWLTDTVKCPIS